MSLLVFVAALGPMLTVPAIRRLLDAGHASPAAMHAFVAIGMMGAATGAPLFGRAADRRGSPLGLAALLAAVDAFATFVTSSSPPAWLLFALRPVHGAASMGLLALLFAELRERGGSIVRRAGAPMVAALAVGPAVGGFLARMDPALPFRVAAGLDAAIALALVVEVRRRPIAPRTMARAPAASIGSICGAMRALLVMTALQRFAIGGLVVSFAVLARAVHGMSDAAVGGSFSLVLVVFAFAMIPLARLEGQDRLRSIMAGGAMFGMSFVALAVAPRGLVPVALLFAGLGSAMVYAPTLSLAAAVAPPRGRATTMALLHGAGAIGMVLGPAVAALLDLAMRGAAASTRAATFLTIAGAVQLVGVFAVSAGIAGLSVRRAEGPSTSHLRQNEERR